MELVPSYELQNGLITRLARNWQQFIDELDALMEKFLKAIGFPADD
jgi:hypothetical protein